MSVLRLPNVIVPGLPHAGTTWLHRVLSSHPDVFVPRRKEVHYYDRNYARGLDWYAEYFERAGTRRLLIDISPTYVFHAQTPQRIAAELPDARVVIVLRHPVTWLVSTFLKIQREHGKGRGSFTKFVAKPGRLDHYRVYGAVEAYTKALGADRVHVALYEDLAADPAAYLRGVCSFLGIDAEPVIAAKGDELGRRENPAVKPRSARIHSLLHGVIRRARRVQWGWLDIALDAGRDVYTRLMSKEASSEKLVVEDATRATIVDTFRPDIERLSSVLDRDLVKYWSMAR